MRQILLDTNVLLHGRFFDQIPWDELAGEEVELLLTGIVLKELDEAGYSNSKENVKDRAKRTKKRLLEIYKAGGTVRSRTRLRIIAGRPAVAIHADDALVQECLQLGCWFCTSDTGATLLALSGGVPLFELPAQYLEPVLVEKGKNQGERLPKLVPVLWFGGRPLSEGSELVVTVPRAPTNNEILMRLGEMQEVERRASPLMDAWESEFHREPVEPFQRERALFASVAAEREQARALEIVFALRNEGSAPASTIVVVTECSGASLIKGARLTHDCLLHSLEEPLGSFEVLLPDFQCTGLNMTIEVHCAENRSAEVRSLNLRIRAVEVPPLS